MINTLKQKHLIALQCESGAAGEEERSYCESERRQTSETGSNTDPLSERLDSAAGLHLAAPLLPSDPLQPGKQHPAPPAGGSQEQGVAAVGPMQQLREPETHELFVIHMGGLLLHVYRVFWFFTEDKMCRNMQDDESAV